jgi:PAS domain S-box-containing protein
VAANSKAAEMFGVTLDELLQNKMIDPNWEIVSRDNKPFLTENYPSVITLKTSKPVDNVIMGVKNPNGKKLWVSINSRPIFDKNNQLEYIVVSTKDITEQEVTKSKLEESELLFSTFFYNTTSACVIYDENNFVVKGNEEFFKAIGVAPTKKPVAIKDIFTPENAKDIINRNTLFFKNQTSSRSPFQIVTKNGATRKYLLTLNLLEISGKKYIAGHATDVTELSNAEAKIKLMNERLSYVAKVATDAFWDYNLITKEVFRSENFLTLTGYKNSEIVNTNKWWHSNIHPDDQVRVKTHIQKAVEKGKESWTLEYRFKYADDNYHHILDNGYIIYDKKEAIRAVGAIKDITEKVLLEKQVVAQQIQQEKLITQAAIKAQEEERNKISGELHDNVNQLLMSAKIHLGMLKQSKTLNTEFVDAAVKYILMAVEEIRVLCQKLNNNTVKTMGLQKSIIDVCNLLTLNNNTKSNVVIDETLIPQLSYEKQLVIFRIIQEQTSNIIKHANAQNVAVSLKKAGTQCELIIEDDGKGLDTSQTKKKGIGFINISNRVKAYNGSVTIENGTKNGVVLRASLPIQSVVSSASLIN